jgi:metal-dependent amidase/aminoacylase/carboxypeptidase family protein
MEGKGSKELQNCLTDLERVMTPNILLDWAETIEQTAKEICNDPDCKRIKFRYTEESGFAFEISDKEAADCIIKAIQEYDNSQSIIIRDGSKVLIEDLEKSKNDLK